MFNETSIVRFVPDLRDANLVYYVDSMKRVPMNFYPVTNLPKFRTNEAAVSSRVCVRARRVYEQLTWTAFSIAFGHIVLPETSDDDATMLCSTIVGHDHPVAARSASMKPPYPKGDVVCRSIMGSIEVMEVGRLRVHQQCVDDGACAHIARRRRIDHVRAVHRHTASRHCCTRRTRP